MDEIIIARYGLKKTQKDDTPELERNPNKSFKKSRMDEIMIARYRLKKTQNDDTPEFEQNPKKELQKIPEG